MAKLLDLFESREEELYGKFKQKSSGENEPYVVVPLSEADPIDHPSFEDQSNPVSLSARRDLRRLTNFSTSTKGIVFLAKQQLLQSGNTFADTRLYNPANVLVHAVPFVHEPRHINLRGGVIQSLLEATGVEFGNPNPLTMLQSETVEESKMTNRSSWAWRNQNTLGGILTNTDNSTVDLTSQQSLKNSILNLGRSFARNAIDQIVSPFRRTVSGIDAQLNGAQGTARPEIEARRSQYYDEVAKEYGQYTDENPFSDAPNEQSGTSYVQALRQWKTEGNDRISIGVGSATRERGRSFGISSATDGRKFIAQKRYYQDLTQVQDFLPFIGTDDDFTSTLDADSIDVLFYVNNPENNAEERVRFRALLSGLQESVSPSYNENKYIGRYETYYTYNNIVRDTSFTLTLHAFSKEERNNIIRKMTYLSSLAYPADSDRYLTPLVLKFTIGQLYFKQPALIMGVNHSIEDDTSWDIDSQTPMTIISQISLRLLDKRLYTYGYFRSLDTPFANTIENAQYMPNVVREREVVDTITGTPVSLVPSGELGEENSGAGNAGIEETNRRLGGGSN